MKRPAFTLVEIMLSAAIMAVLTSIVFFNFSRQNQRQALSQSINLIATELQHMTANAQSGIIFGTQPPKQYGLSFELLNASGQPKTSFETFADVQPIQTPPALYDTSTAELIQTFTFQKHVAVACLSTGLTTANLQYKRLDIGYTVPGGRLTAVGILQNTSAVVMVTDPLRVTLRDDRTGECQRVSIPLGVTSISVQKLTSCSCL